MSINKHRCIAANAESKYTELVQVQAAARDNRNTRLEN